MPGRRAAIGRVLCLLGVLGLGPGPLLGADPILDSLSLEEKLGQLFLVALDTESAARYEPDIRAGRLGAGLLRWDRFTGEQARAFSARMRDWALSSPKRVPFLIAADHEGGSVFTQHLYGLTSFPGNMALGAAGEPALAEEAARAMGLELKSLGIDLDFAPVLDLGHKKDNPVIGIRSFGSEPGMVSRLGAAAVRGFGRAGLLSCPKHFPGHGDTDVDSHLGLPVIRRSPRELEGAELPPFRAALAAGAPLLMPAHVIVEAWDPERPVTLSSAALLGRLRGQLGFKGVIVSDSLDMGAIAGSHGIGEAALLAFEAGCDLLVLGKGELEPAFAALLEAARSGRVSRERLGESAGRVLALKRRAGLFGKGGPAASGRASSRSAHEALARRIAQKAVTLTRDDGNLVPLPRRGRRLLVLCRSERFAREAEGFARDMESRHARTRTLFLPPQLDSARIEEALAAAREADVIVAGTFLWGGLDADAQKELLRRLLALGKPLVQLSLMNPYDILWEPASGTALCLYGLTPPTLKAVARVLAGEIPARGKLPVLGEFVERLSSQQPK